MKKALEARKNRHKKLTVLREYAQDPLTSDEGAKKRNGNVLDNRTSNTITDGELVGVPASRDLRLLLSLSSRR